MKYLLILTMSFNLLAYNLNGVEYVNEASSYSLDALGLLDLDTINETPFLESTKGLSEKIGDKDLAKIVVIVNRAPKDTAEDAQRAKVYIDGVLVKTFTVSTGKIGHLTRTGYFRPVYSNHLRVYDNYYSSKYGSRMAKAIFFYGGYAIHHTNALKNLGKRASHGCVRFHIDDISWINDRVIALGNPYPTLRKWRHSKHKGTSKYNVHYKGLDKLVNPIGRYSGVLNTKKKVRSLDLVILVKDQRD